MVKVNLEGKDKKTMEVFSLYLQSYGAKKAHREVYVEEGGDYDFNNYNYWQGDGVGLTISEYETISDVFEEIIKKYDNLLFEEFGWDERGSIMVFFDCIDKKITFKAYVYKMSQESEGRTFELNLNDFDESSQEFLKDAMKDHPSGRLEYEGSGDSGYIQDDMEFPDGERGNVPEGLQDYCYGKLNHYGGWEINEGSNGYFEFDFEDKKIIHVHNTNYEDSNEVEIPLELYF